MQLKQLAKNKLMIYFAYFIGIAVLAYLLRKTQEFLIYDSNLFVIQQYEIMGNKYLTHRDIVSLSGVALQDKLFEQDIAVIETRIKRSPYIRKVKVDKKLPSTLQIILEETKPLAYIQDGNLKIISDNLRVLPRAIDYDYPDLPIILSNKEYQLEEGEKIDDKQLVRILTKIKLIQAVSVDLLALISEINLIDDKERFYFINGRSEFIMDESNLKEQLLNFRYFLDRRDAMKVLEKAEYIDIRFTDKIIVKDRKS